MEIPRDVAKSQRVPEDLDSSVGGRYEIPSPRRRRRAALVYLAGAVLAASGTALGLGVEVFGVAAALGLIALYHLLTAWDLVIREPGALELANREAGFPVGHASAALGHLGWRARPVWNVLVYSADDPPSQRGLVRVDAVHGEVIDSYVERVPLPEDPTDPRSGRSPGR